MSNEESTAAVGDLPATTETAAAVADSKTDTDAGKGEGQGEAETSAQAGGEGEDAGEPKAPVVPEAYTVPDGYAIGESHMAFVSGIAKNAGMTQEQFNLAVPKWAELREQERQFERGEWAVQSEDEFGKDFKGITAGATRAIVELEKERPGITERLDATNLGNHPDVLWAFYKIGVLLTPKKMDGIESEGSVSKPRSIEERLWGSKTA